MTKKQWFRQRRALHSLFVQGAVLWAALLFFPNSVPFGEGEGCVRVRLSGEEMGIAADEETARECLRLARREAAARSGDIVFSDAVLELAPDPLYIGKLDDGGAMAERMLASLMSRREASLEHCYTIRVGAYRTTLASMEEVEALFNAMLDKYDPDSLFSVGISADGTRKLPARTAEVMTRESALLEEEKRTAGSFVSAGIDRAIDAFFDAVKPVSAYEVESSYLGLKSICFGEHVEIAECYMPASRITGLEQALLEVQGDVAANTIHEVVPGDSLEDIALGYHLTMEELIGMNPLLESGETIIRPGDQVTVRVAKPVLPVEYTIQERYEETYLAPTIYKDNAEWFTGTKEEVQAPKPGMRRVVASISYVDGERTRTDIVEQEILEEAVPGIVERGTKARSSYVWPVSGGYITSHFGRRSRPKAGASTYHQGTDIGVPTGTAVMASSGGTVVQAGWMGNYGNVIFINHPDGRQTRYGHLSRVLVKVGDTVSQGQKIALSGNTGNSTGPHLHFEMRIGGNAVDVLDYIPYGR